MNFDLTIIQENAFIYETHLRNINRRRELWSKDTRNCIFETLESVQKNFTKIDWSVGVDNSKKNYETITLKISDSPSGIATVDSNGKETKSYTETGASLGFSQMISGKIKVWFDYPHVDDIQEGTAEIKELVTIEPSYVNASLIGGYVQQFLYEITMYESKF